VVFFVFLAPLFLVFVVLVVVVLSFISGAGVVVVVVVFSDVAGACANVTVTNAKLINTANTIIHTFFIFLPPSVVNFASATGSTMHYMCH
jgi:hypothetical protein